MKYSLVLLTLFCCCRTMAQQRFIEVTVTDTVLAKADLFVYRILLAPDDDYSEFTGSSKGHASLEDLTELRMSKARRMFDSLKETLKAEGFILFKSSLSDSVNIYQRAIRYFSARIITHSIDSLGMLYRRLKDKKGFIGTLELAVAAHDSSYQKKLFKKILGEAWSKAETIAAYSDQHVRGVLTVTENKTAEGSTGGWTSYPPLSELAESVIPGWHTTIGSPASVIGGGPSLDLSWYPMAESFTVRFLVE